MIGVSFDVGLRAGRELLDVPVVGMTEAACLVACTLGGRFGIVTYGRRSAGIFREMVAGYGLASRLAGVHGLEATPADMLADPQALHGQIAGAANGLVERDGAEVVILAGAVMAGLPPLIQDLALCPLVEGIASGVGLAELLVRLGPAKARTGSFARIGERAVSGLGPELSALLARNSCIRAFVKEDDVNAGVVPLPTGRSARIAIWSPRRGLQLIDRQIAQHQQDFSRSTAAADREAARRHRASCATGRHGAPRRRSRSRVRRRQRGVRMCGHAPARGRYATDAAHRRRGRGRPGLWPHCLDRARGTRAPGERAAPMSASCRPAASRFWRSIARPSRSIR